MSPADAIAIRQNRRARVRTIRRRVIAGAVALFVAVWLLITLMLVTGHDPALASQTTTTRTAAQTTSSTAGTGTGTSSSAGSTSSSTGSTGSNTGTTSSNTGTGSSSGGTSSVTSRQS